MALYSGIKTVSKITPETNRMNASIANILGFPMANKATPNGANSN